MKTCLTFDFDAMSVWLGSAKSANPSQISRGEFGAVACLRILDLMKRKHIRCSFCVPGHTALAYPDIIKRIDAEGHELVHHGWVHENPADFDRQGEREILQRGIETLEQITGVRPIGYRSPAWDFSLNTTALLLEHEFVYDSSFMGDDFSPYYLRRGDRFSATEPYRFGSNVDLVELPVHWSLDDFPQFEFVFGAMTSLNAPRVVEQNWRDDFDWAVANVPEGLFTLTLHPQVIGRGSRLAMLERLIEHMNEYSTFLTMGEFAVQWREANPLRDWVQSGNIHVREAVNE